MERPRTGAQEWLRIRLPLVPRPVRRPTQHSGANAVIVTDPDYRPPVSDEEDKDAEGEVKARNAHGWSAGFSDPVLFRSPDAPKARRLRFR